MNLDENPAFIAFITDIYVNTKVNIKDGNNKADSCLLLDRFMALLIQLDGKEEVPQ